MALSFLHSGDRMERSRTYYKLKLKRDDLWSKHSDPLNLWCVKNYKLWKQLKGYA